ncbi:hypothetical protein CEE36_05510 [candidate division TA06 bacterium B3_TA06]|uniref:Uncharacterized protein n=1 Tax=candidate division TA06 bacterium B3_TA06 TaxID=2012487 RepID=A0A532V6X3_UNCT6|nr:MAG: hypothetical protein CEE36_05510 [candidate division TA06 bacterium B3_TA06]
MSIDRRVMALMILASLMLPAAGFAQDRLELVGFDVVELEDALERSATENWLEHAETGQRVVEGLDFLLVISPDSKWILLGQPIEEEEGEEGEGGLDVVTYKLFIVSTADPQLIALVDQALYATFSPTSDYLFVATVPNPIVYDLEDMRGVVLTAIRSGLENYPCWVSQWSKDGKVLIIHQQFSFDDSSNPRAWRVELR